jgi:hypothetical protein
MKEPRPAPEPGRSCGAYAARPCGFRLARLVLVSLLALPLAAQVPPAVRVEVRLLSPVSSYHSRSGDPIEALVATPLCLEGGGALPEGAIISSHIARVHRVGLGLVHETASIQLQFTDLRFPDGRSFPIDARLIEIDGARERIDRHGKIHGIRATAALSNRFGQRLVFEAMENPLAMAPLFLIETGVFHFPEPEIEYPRGTELYLDVQLPSTFGRAEACVPPAAYTGEDAEALARLIAELPYWSYTKRQSQPSDLVNLVYVGQEAALRTVFAAAGWNGSDPNSIRSGVNAIRAIVQGGAYEEAPMRTLLLDGADPGFTLQKSLNTFEKRHHLRIWQRSGEWYGQPIWASAATEDVGATFSLRRPFGFTHQIEPNVDLERDKVVSDLLFTGCVDSVTYVPRPGSLRSSGQEYRRGVSSDARVAVVVLNDCGQPRLSPSGEPQASPPAFVRCFRRAALTARNHFLRDNIVWRSADAARLGFQTLHGWTEARRDERRARESDTTITLQARAQTLPPRL